MRNGSGDKRRRLEEQLGWALSDEQWALLVQKRYDADIENHELGVQEVAAEIKGWLIFAGPGSGGGARPRMLGDADRDSSGASGRQYALSVLLAAEAERDEHLRRFRETHLPKGLLEWTQVQGWVEREAEAAGPPTLYIEMPLPEEVRLRADASGEVVFEPALQLARVPGAAVTMCGPRWLTYGVPDDERSRRVATASGTTLERLRLLAADLAQRYGWSPGQAVVFVLTGIMPRHALVRTRREVRPLQPATSRIELSVDPSVTPEELAEYYRASRRRMMPRRRHRPMSRKTLTLVVFAAEREGETWGEMRERWNQAVRVQHPDWFYTEARRREFRRDIVRARARLLRPPYVDPSAGHGSSYETAGEVLSVVVSMAGEDDV